MTLSICPIQKESTSFVRDKDGVCLEGTERWGGMQNITNYTVAGDKKRVCSAGSWHKRVLRQNPLCQSSHSLICTLSREEDGRGGRGCCSNGDFWSCLHEGH